MIGAKRHWASGWWLGIAAVIVAAGARGAPAEDRPAIDLHDQQAMAALVADLGSGEFAVRERAQKRVDTIPPSQKNDLLKLAAETLEPEAHARLLRRVDMLEELGATDPPPLSLELRGATLATVAAELSKALGVPITPSGAMGADRYTLVAKDLPLWEIINRLSRQHPLMLAGSGTRLTLTGGTTWRDDVIVRGFAVGLGDLRWQQAGVQANAILMQNGNIIQVVNLGANNGVLNAVVVGGGNLAVGGGIVVQGNGNLLLQAGAAAGPALTGVLTIAADPRVHLLGIAGSELVQAVDDAGNRLIPPGGDSGRGASSIVRGTTWSRSFALDAPERLGKTLRTLRGRVVVTVALSEKTIEVQDPEKHQGDVLYRGEREVALQQFVVTRDNALGGMAMVRLQLRVNEMPGTPAFGGIPVNPVGTSTTAVRATLVDARGTQFSTLFAGNGLTGTTIRTNVVEPLKLVITVPEKTRDVVVPFEFKDVPIPGQ